MNKKIKRQSVKKSKLKSKPKKISKKISKKKVGKGINLENDYKELLQLKQQGIELNTLVNLTFKDGRKIGTWIGHHKRQLNKEQLEALGLIEVQAKPIDKYMKLKEKYLKLLSNKSLSSSEKFLLMNNLRLIEKNIEKQVRKDKKKGGGSKKFTENNNRWIENPLTPIENDIKPPSRNGPRTAWTTNPLYESVKQPRQYEEDYGTYTFEEIPPVIPQTIVRIPGKKQQKGDKVEVASVMYIDPEEGKRKIVKGVFERKPPSKVYYL